YGRPTVHSQSLGAGAELVLQVGFVKGTGGKSADKSDAVPSTSHFPLRPVDPVISERLHLLTPLPRPQREVALFPAGHRVERSYVPTAYLAGQFGGANDFGAARNSGIIHRVR